jgi:hypothetical protein
LRNTRFKEKPPDKSEVINIGRNGKYQALLAQPMKFQISSRCQELKGRRLKISFMKTFPGEPNQIAKERIVLIKKNLNTDH